MQELLTRGVAGPAMQIFLTNRPGEHGVKQTARSVDSALAAAHTALAQTALDALQRTTFLLGDLRGLLASAPTYAGLGIQVCPCSLHPGARLTAPRCAAHRDQACVPPGRWAGWQMGFRTHRSS